jgi:hypothetical protein
MLTDKFSDRESLSLSTTIPEIRATACYVHVYLHVFFFFVAIYILCNIYKVLHRAIVNEAQGRSGFIRLKSDMAQIIHIHRCLLSKFQ